MKTLIQSILITGITIMTVNAHADEEKTANINPVVVMTTNKGTIEIELFSDRAPNTVSNFLSYVLQSYYDGTIFHRVMEGFMIQGGGYTPDMVEKPKME